MFAPIRDRTGYIGDPLTSPTGPHPHDGERPEGPIDNDYVIRL